MERYPISDVHFVTIFLPSLKQVCKLNGRRLDQATSFAFIIFILFILEHYIKLQSHIAEIHKEEVEEKEPLNNMMACPDCDQLYVTPMELYRHYETMHFTNDKDKDEGYNLYCDPCKITLNSSNDYFEHQKTVHRMKRSAEPIKCNWCNVRFRGTGRFGVHIRSTHNQQKMEHLKTGTQNVAREDESQLCSICGKVLGSPGQLTLHLETHSTKSSFQCSLCKNLFKYTLLANFTSSCFYCKLLV